MPTLTTRHALALLCAAAPTAFAQTSEPVLPPVPVTDTALRRSSGQAGVGSFGDAPVLQTPAAIGVVTSEQMQERGIRQSTDLLRVDASLNEAYNTVGYAEQFSVRGFTLDNAASYRKDGMFITSDAQIPLENKERIEVLRGLSGLQAGIATPGGILNYVTKRPTNAPLRSVTLEARERGTLYGAVDLGGRAEDTRFGYRINAAAERLRSYVRGADGERQFVSGAFDWRLTPQALLQLDLDYQRKSQLSVPGFQLLNNTDLPTGVSARTMLNNQPWSRPVETGTGNVGLRFDYQFNTDWSAALSANRHRFTRDDFAAFPYGCASAGLFPGFCANGDFDVYDYQSENEAKTLLSTQALVQGKFTTGALPHELAFGVSTLRRRDEFGDCVYGTLDCAGSAANGSSNLYAPRVVAPSTMVTGPVLLRRRGDERSLFVQDIIGLGSTLKLHAGVRHTRIERRQFDTAGTGNGRHDKGYTLPNLALVFNPRNDVTLYGSYAQGLEHGGVAPLLTTNVNQLLDPSKSKQFELGAKAAISQDWTVSAAVFDITKPLEYTNTAFTYVRNGEARHTGLELAADGRLTRNLTVGTSVAALRARQRGTGETALDGNRPTNVPAFKSVVYVDYLLPQLTGWGVNASWQHSGSKAFSPDNRVTVPGYNVFNLGARYATKMAGMQTTVRVNVDNVFDKFYWRDVTQSLGGYLFPGAPRTLRVSAQFDF